MPMRQPQRPEARVWLEQFNKHLMAWLSSSRSDEGELRAAFVALRSMMEREPECAETVSNLCATLLHQHGDALQPDLAADMASLGLDAEQIRSDDHPLRWAERALLYVALARAGAAHGRRMDALQALSAIELPPGEGQSPTECLRRYIGGKVDAQRAELYEAGLDCERARSHAESALQACDWLMTPEENLGGLLRGLTNLFYGPARLPDEVVQAVLQSTWSDLSRNTVRNAVRAARCAIAFGEKGAESPEIAPSIERALERIAARGIADLTAIDFIAFFRHAPAKLCVRLIEAVPAAAEAVHVERGPFDALLPAAAAAYAQCSAAERRRYLKTAAAVEDAEEPVVRAVGLGLLVVAEAQVGKGKTAPRHADAFLHALDEFIRKDDPAVRDWRIRAEFDEALGVLIERAAARVAAGADVADRVSLAHLLDSLRVAPPQTLAWLSVFARDGATTELEPAQRHADDLLGRLAFALQGRPQAAGVIIQAAGEKTLFICITGSGVQLFEAGDEFRRAAFAAAQCAAEQMDLYADLHVPPDDASMKSAGLSAYEALPAGVRTLLSNSTLVLLCPDYRAGTSSVPFELLHDGNEWLGIAKVIARLPSLAAMVRAAEGGPRRVLERRLLAIAIANAEGWPPLPAAQAEVETVRSALAKCGWDAPAIDESRVDPEFILNRTPFAAHMHIAGHGEVGGTDEALVLARSSRLTAEAVVNGSYGCTPTVWLNTCVLGQARYLGGGVVRGVAQAFVEAGAPAVIANLLPVDDRASSHLVERFYRHAADEDFGESLRRARRDLAGEGVSSVLWGSTVLLGDPRVTLEPKAAALADRQNMLVEAITKRDDPAFLAQLTLRIESKMRGSPCDPLWACASEIVKALREGAEASPHDLPRLAGVCRLCLRIDAWDAAAMAAFALSELTQDEDPFVSLLVTEGAINLLRPVEAVNRDWREFTDRLLVRAEQLRRGDRALRAAVQVPEGTDAAEAEATRLMGETVMEIRLVGDLRSRWHGLTPQPRKHEAAAEDILWNAVMAERTKRFEDMPETFAYARQVAEKLARRGDLAPGRVPRAATMLAGLLRWMWDGHNRVAVEKEVIEGHTRVALLALESLKTDSAQEAAWWSTVSAYSTEIRRSLGELDALPYGEKLYAEMNKAIAHIRDDGLARLEKVRSDDPGRVPDAMTYLLGTLIEVNTYSYTDGSVPEEICEKLKSVHHELSMKAQGCLMPWLMEGFRAAREAPVDELQRWCYGIERPVEGAGA